MQTNLYPFCNDGTQGDFLFSFFALASRDLNDVETACEHFFSLRSTRSRTKTFSPILPSCSTSSTSDLLAPTNTLSAFLSSLRINSEHEQMCWQKLRVRSQMPMIYRHPVWAANRAIRFADHVTKRKGVTWNEKRQLLVVKDVHPKRL